MSKKKFCWKRRVSVLLAMAMLITAAPQTGMSVYATGGGNVDDLLSADDVTAQETAGDENDGDLSGDETTTAPGGTDESENVGGGTGKTENPEVPEDPEKPDLSDDADQPDDGGEAGDSEDEAEPGESGDELTADEESVSMNDIGADIMSADEPMAALETDDGTPWYEKEDLLQLIIEERTEDDDDPYTRLVIRVNKAKENNVSVADIAEYYREKQGSKTFNCVQLDTSQKDSSQSAQAAAHFIKDDFNAALELLADDDRRWIDYTFCFEIDQVNIGYTLYHPVEMRSDFNVAYKVKALENQGFIINLSKVDGYPTERVDGLSINWNKEGLAIDKYLESGDGVEPRVVLAEGKDNKPSKMMDIDNINLNGNGFGVGVGQAFAPRYEGDTQILFEANKDYRVENLYIDKKKVPIDGQLELTAKNRSSAYDVSTGKVEWVVLSPDKIELTLKENDKNLTAQATGKEIGDAYYWVKYNADQNDFSELHQVKVAYVKNGAEYSYIGDISTDEDGSRRLRISEEDAKKNGLEVGDILHYYFTQSGDSESEWTPDQTFDAVQLDMQAEHSNGSGGTTTMKATIDKEIYNQACDLLDDENDNCRIDYNVNYHLKNGDGSYGEYREFIGYSLNRPKAMEENADNLSVTCTVDPLANQGVIINLDRAKADFPVNKKNNGEVFLNWNIDGFQADSYFIDSSDVRVLAWDGSKPTEVLDNVYVNIRSDGMSMSLPNEDVQSYMVTSLYVDEAIGLNDTRELAAGQRAGSESADVSSAAWTLLSDLITITPAEGSTATLKANESNVGEAYYWVKYQADSKDYSELHSINVAILQDGKELVYIGDVEKGEFDDRPDIQYMRLRISEQEAVQKNKNAGIIDILDYHIEQIENGQENKFNCVEFTVSDSSPKTRKMNKDYINKALEITEDLYVEDNDEVRDQWIDYNFLSYDANGYETGVKVEYTLSSFKGEVQKDIPATFTVTNLANQGVKVKFASMDFPADYVSMRYNQPAWYDGMADEGGQFRLFTHSSGTPTAMVSVADDQGMGDYNRWGSENAPWSQLSFYNIKPLGSKEYLVASIYEDLQYNENGPIGDMPFVGVPTQMKAGIRAGGGEDTVLTSATWKSFDTDKATIDKNGILTAWISGEEIYYYVKYKVGKDTYLEVHRTQATSEVAKIAFDRAVFDINYPDSAYLELRWYPSINVDRNPDRLKWEITEGEGVVSFLNTGDGGADIRAKGSGEATVKVSYLAGSYKEGDGGNWDFEPSGEVICTAECTINVVERLEWHDVHDALDSVDFYAVMDVDATLADIADLLPESETGKYEWAVPTAKLTTFKGMGGNLFTVKYTANDGQIFYTPIWVNFVTLKGIHMMYAVGEGEDVSTWDEWHEVPVSVTKGGKLKLGYYYDLENAEEPEEQSPEDPGKARYDRVMKKLEDAGYKVEWTVVDKQDPPKDGDYYVYDTNLLTAGKKVKKNFTVSVVQYNGTKKKVICKDTRSVTVTMKDLADLDQIGAVTIKYDANDGNKPWLVVEVNDPGLLENYSLTPSSEDTAILKLSTKAADKIMNNSPEVTDKGVGNPGDADEEGKQYIKIACTTLKPGHAWIKLTSNDEMGTFRRYTIYTPDCAPKAVSSTTIAINKAKTDKPATVMLRTHKGYPLKAGDGDDIVGDEAKNIDFLVKNQASSQLEISAKLTETTPDIQDDGDQEQYNLYEITVELNESNPIANGKHTVTLNLKVDNDESGGAYTLPLTLNVSDSMPKVTFKQTKKVNVFYNDGEGNGELAVTVANGEEIESLELINYVDSKNPNKNADCAYELRNEEGVYYIVWKDKAPGEGSGATEKMDSGLKKGLLKYKLKGFSGDPVSVTYTVSTENKKPQIVMATSSDTLYLKTAYTYSWISVIDKATGQNLELDPTKDTVRRVVDAKKGLYDKIEAGKGDGDADIYTGLEVKDTNNPYKLNAYDWGEISTELMDSSSYKYKTDKFTLDIQKSNWTAPISLSYKITVSNSAPKLALSSSTVTLNKNSDVYYAQQALVTLRLKGYIKEFDPEDYVKFAGVDDKSKKVLSGLDYNKGDNSLTLDYWNENYTSDVAVRLKNDLIPTGTYKFRISVFRSWQSEPYASAILTVKIVDSPVSKNIKVTAKGTIDLMDREGTSVTYTPKLTNLSGRITDAWLEGRDAERFAFGEGDGEDYRSWWDGSKLTVKANPDYYYSTKETYEVVPVFWVEVENYSGYRIEGKPVTIKLKQGKPKLTAAAAQNNTNVIYRNLDNEVEIKLSSIYNKKDVEIANVWLASYTDDFKLVECGQDEDGNSIVYDSDTQTIRLKLQDRYDANSVVKSGKTWKVKIQVWYSNQAANEKAGEVTYSVVVR